MCLSDARPPHLVFLCERNMCVGVYACALMHCVYTSAHLEATLSRTVQ